VADAWWAFTLNGAFFFVVGLIVQEVKVLAAGVFVMTMGTFLLWLRNRYLKGARA
jgi:hypothetical protein